MRQKQKKRIANEKREKLRNAIAATIAKRQAVFVCQMQVIYAKKHGLIEYCTKCKMHFDVRSGCDCFEV